MMNSSVPCAARQLRSFEQALRQGNGQEGPSRTNHSSAGGKKSIDKIVGSRRRESALFQKRNWRRGKLIPLPLLHFPFYQSMTEPAGSSSGY